MSIDSLTVAFYIVYMLAIGSTSTLVRNCGYCAKLLNSLCFHTVSGIRSGLRSLFVPLSSHCVVWMLNHLNASYVCHLFLCRFKIYCLQSVVLSLSGGLLFSLFCLVSMSPCEVPDRNTALFVASYLFLRL